MFFTLVCVFICDVSKVSHLFRECLTSLIKTWSFCCIVAFESTVYAEFHHHVFSCGLLRHGLLPEERGVPRHPAGRAVWGGKQGVGRGVPAFTGRHRHRRRSAAADHRVHQGQSGASVQIHGSGQTHRQSPAAGRWSLCLGEDQNFNVTKTFWFSQSAPFHRSALRNKGQPFSPPPLCLFQLSVAPSAPRLTPTSSPEDSGASVWSWLSGWSNEEPPNWCWRADQASGTVRGYSTCLVNRRGILWVNVFYCKMQTGL